MERGSGNPLYRQIADRIAADMDHGVYKAGEPLPSIQQLTSSLGVARNTVIGALRHLVRTGKAVSSHGKGFYAKGAADTLPIVDLLAPLHYSYHLQVYVGMIAGAQDATEKIGARVEFHDTRELTADFLTQLDKVSALRPGGHLIAVTPQEDFGPYGCPECAAALERLARSGTRIVVVDRRGPASLPRIVQDKLAGRRLLLRHAVKAGCRSVLFFDAFEDEEQLRSEAAAIGLGESVYFVKSKTPRDDIELALRLRAEAVLCAGDLRARRIINLMGTSPKLKVGGYDATQMATAFHPRITSVNNNLAEAGHRAVEMLFSANLPVSEEYRIEPFLVPGETL